MTSPLGLFFVDEKVTGMSVLSLSVVLQNVSHFYAMNAFCRFFRENSIALICHNYTYKQDYVFLGPQVKA